MNFKEYIERHLFVVGKLNESLELEIANAIQLIYETIRSGHKILICGNGGSAADSQHFAAELICSLDHSIKRKGFAAISLATDTSVITAQANDFSFDEVFSRQIEALGREADLLIVFSTSGESSNIQKAIEAAHNSNLKVISFTGKNGISKHRNEIELRVPSQDTQVIQECHVVLYHFISLQVEMLAARI
jgi:D-sedoheptulose 7-phosphate isomerase